MKYLISRVKDGYAMMVADEAGIVYIALGDDRQSLLADFHLRCAAEAEHSSIAEDAADSFLLASMQKLTDYLNGRSEDLSDLRLHLQGTDFQQRVWKQLMGIPRGLTFTYQQIAKTIGTHPRAIGNACAANKLAVVVPCHRVVPHNTQQRKPSDKSGNESTSAYSRASTLGHYRWGTQWKSRLLQMEKAWS